MQWVETTGRTIDDAKEAALDELGVDEADAEFEILSEPKLGLFGRLRTEGRVRARVRPTAPRAKEDRRDRRRRSKPSGHTTPPDADDASGGEDEPAEANDKPPTTEEDVVPTERRVRPPKTEPNAVEQGASMDVTLDEQARAASEFLHGLLERFGIDAEVSTRQNGEESVDINVEGGDLGVLIGPKGSTLVAVQDLTRTIVQRRTGATNGRIFVDIAGYRHKRAEALSRFAVNLAEEVRRTGVRTALEPMTAADRRVVHDAVSHMDGLTTISEGEDPSRRVVIVPEGQPAQPLSGD